MCEKQRLQDCGVVLGAFADLVLSEGSVFNDSIHVPL